MTSLDLNALQPWYHAITVGDYVTPGKVDPTVRARLALDQLPEDLTGASVVDVGGNCGGVAFEFAKRGAEATVFELSAHYRRQGEILSELLHLPVRFRHGTVYDLTGRYDIVVCFGLIYHLRDPFRALDVLRGATRERMFISSRVNPSTGHVWAMGNVLGHVPDAEAAHDWWLPSVRGMTATLNSYGWKDVALLAHDEERSEAFWIAHP